MSGQNSVLTPLSDHHTRAESRERIAGTGGGPGTNCRSHGKLPSKMDKWVAGGPLARSAVLRGADTLSPVSSRYSLLCGPCRRVPFRARRNSAKTPMPDRRVCLGAGKITSTGRICPCPGLDLGRPELPGVRRLAQIRWTETSDMKWGEVARIDDGHGRSFLKTMVGWRFWTADASKAIPDAGGVGRVTTAARRHGPGWIISLSRFLGPGRGAATMTGTAGRGTHRTAPD